MRKLTVCSIIMSAILCMAVFTPGVNAQSMAEEESGSYLYGSALPSNEMLYSISFALSDNSTATDNVTMTKAEILKEKGVPGKGIDKAPGLQKFFNAFSRAMERLRNRFHVRSNNSFGDGISDNSTATDNVTMTKSEILKEKGVPGKGIDQAPGLQKQFNPNSNAGNGVMNRNQEKVKDKNKANSGQSDNVTMDNADFNNQNGVPGGGAGKAPGQLKKNKP